MLTAKMPTITTTLTGKVMLAFGDDVRAAGVLGQRRGITLARSPDRYLDQDQIAILGTQRFDAVLHDCGDNSELRLARRAGRAVRKGVKSAG
jgi:HK97 family phage major capsid protein